MLQKLFRLTGFAFAAGLGLCSAVAQSEAPASRAEEIQRERQEKATKLEPAKPDVIEEKFLLFEQGQVLQKLSTGGDGFFPKLGGMPTGQGLALGLQYSRKDLAGGQIKLDAMAIGSFAKSQLYHLGITAPYLAGDKLEWKLSAERRTLTRVDFYGLGPYTEVENRTSYQLEDTTVSTSLGFHPLGDRFTVGPKLAFMQTNTGRGFPDQEVPATEDVYTDDQVPGLDAQGNFVRLGGFAALDFRDNKSLARSGTLLRTDFTAYQDLDLGRYDFNKLELEVQQYVPFFNKRRVIALRARTEMNFAGAGQAVPFYLKPWIGGPQELRGFRNYRFRDDNILVLNAEYRWEAFSGLDMALFLDAGQAVAQRRDFARDKMETAAGVGFRFNIRNATFLRLDVGFSHESVQMWLRWGSPF